MNLSGKTGTNHTVESFKVEDHKVQNFIYHLTLMFFHDF